MSHVSTQILHQSYTLACPEGEEGVLHQAVAQLDAAMLRHWESGKLRLREQAAVLVAVNMSVENIKLQADLAAARAELAALQAQTPAAARSAEASCCGSIEATATPPLVDATDALPADALPDAHGAAAIIDHSDLLSRIDAALAQHPHWPALQNAAIEQPSATPANVPEQAQAIDHRQGQLFS